MKKKLAVALNVLSPYWHEVFDALGEKLWDVTIFVGAESDPDREYNQSNYSQYSFRVIKNRSLLIDLRRLRFRTRFLHLPVGLWKDLVRLKPDVIISNELGIKTIIALVYGKLRRVPIIPWVCVTKHTERNNSLLREIFRRWILRQVPVVCTNLSDGTEYLRVQMRLPSDKIIHTPYVVDFKRYNSLVFKSKPEGLALRSELGLRGDVLLYVGQMIRRKGIWQLKEALLALPQWIVCSFSFLFVGGSLPIEMKEQLHSADINFADVSFVQPPELPKYYAMASAFLFPTLEDEWGIVINEAAAAGLPIIASKYAGATTDLVVEDRNGVVFDPLVTEDIVRALTKFGRATLEVREEWSKNSLQAAQKLGIDFTVSHFHIALGLALRGVV